MKTLLRVGLFSLAVGLGASAGAFDSVEEMFFRTKLEKTIADKYTDAIATKLPRDQFNVSVQVQLQQIESKRKVAAVEDDNDEKSLRDLAPGAPQQPPVAPAAQQPAPSQQPGAPQPGAPQPAAQQQATPPPAPQEAAFDPEKALNDAVAKKQAELDNIRPADLMLGMIDAEALLAAQQKEIETLRATTDRRPAQAQMPQFIQIPQSAAPVAQQPTLIQPVIQPIIHNAAPVVPKADERPQYKIARVAVTVGISDRYPDEYLTELQHWVDQRVDAEFGANGHAYVERMEPAPPAPEKEEKNSPQAQQQPQNPQAASPTKELSDEEKWLQRFSALQNFLGLLMLAIASIVGVVLWKMIGRDHLGRDIALKLQRTDNAALPGGAPVSGPIEMRMTAAPGLLGAPGMGGAGGGGGGGDDLQVKMLLAKSRDLTAKVGSLAFELEDQLEDLVRIWLEAGEDGHLKTACLLDTMMSYASTSPDAGDWEIPIPKTHERHLSRVFQTMSTLGLDKKTMLLEESYWDLLSVKTLESERPKRLFSYLRTLESTDLEKVLRQADPRVKAVALYHLEPQLQSAVLSGFSPSERSSVFSEALRIDKLGSQELESLDQRLRQDVNRLVIEQPEVGFQRQLTQLLATMTPMEEITLLPEVVASLPDGGYALRKKKPSLAFMDTWSLRARQLVFASASVEEITGLLRAKPEFKNVVYEVCPPRIVTIVDDDLKIARMDADPTLAVESLTQRLRNLINNREISAEDLVSGGANGGGRAYAA